MLANALYGNAINHAPVWAWRDANSDRFSRVTTFAVMRDPCERLLSAIRHCLGAPRASPIDRWAGKILQQAGRTVEDMCYAYLLRPLLRYRLSRVVGFRPQSYWITERGRVSVDELFALRPAFDHVIEREPRAADMNVNVIAPSASTIPPKLRRMAYDHYSADCDLFFFSNVARRIEDAAQIIERLRGVATKSTS
jgi:hypothetical protein